MLARSFVSLSAAIILALGVIHLVYTFWSAKLTPRDPLLAESMKATALVNASHSLALILFGLVYGYLALVQPVVLFQSGFLLLVGFALLASYALLAKVLLVQRSTGGYARGTRVLRGRRHRAPDHPVGWAGLKPASAVGRSSVATDKQPNGRGWRSIPSHRNW